MYFFMCFLLQILGLGYVSLLEGRKSKDDIKVVRKKKVHFQLGFSVRDYHDFGI